MNITSNNTMIFAKEFNGKTFYRASVSSKDKEGKYRRTYIDVRFMGNVEIKDRTKIDIIDGFLSFYRTKEDKDVFIIVVKAFEEVKEIKEQEEPDPFEKFGTQITIEDLDNPDLPF